MKKYTIVYHKIFGEGIVIKNNKKSIIINFKECGIKKILKDYLKYAQLNIIRSASKEEIGEIKKKEFIKKLQSMRYKDYLKSQYWQAIREKALKNADYRCQLCNSQENLNVHHRTYTNKGNEKLEDLIVLCNECHKIFHLNRKIYY